MKSKSNEIMTVKELQAFRVSHGLTQTEFSKLIGVTSQAVRYWELGERSIPPTTAKLVRLMVKFPQLVGEL